MTSHHPIRKAIAPEPTVIPDKLYFRIGDVAKLCDVPAYVLRFWETEFPQLKPNKGGTGQRLYRKRDVEMALRIKSLLYDQGYTIPGARQVFSTESRVKDAPEAAPQLAAAPAPTPAPEPAPSIDVGEAIRQQAHRREQLAALRSELHSLAGLLAKPASPHHPAPSAEAPAPPAPPASKPTSMRPRLVLEPKPDAKAPRLLNQGDLFSSE
ncbi:MAG TPA: MerR family transcriptional regulator [Acidobacteriaceae bacterium]|nr:MerR family transcriptional regulator [Acidobacteriaceae bacterium]